MKYRYFLLTYTAAGSEREEFLDLGRAMAAWRQATEQYSRRVLVCGYTQYGELVSEVTQMDTIPEYLPAVSCNTVEDLRNYIFNREPPQPDWYVVAVPALVLVDVNSASAEGARELAMEATYGASGLAGHALLDRFTVYFPAKSPPNTFEILQGADE